MAKESDHRETLRKALAAHQAGRKVTQGLSEAQLDALRKAAKFNLPKLSPQTEEQLQETNKKLADAAKQYLATRAAERQQQEKEAEQREQIDEELINRAIEFLQNKWGDVECPYCKHTEWQVSQPMALSVSGGEAMSPAFPVMCGNCGHTTFVNAIRAGLLPESDDE